jgi:hypothetical protein
MKKVFKIRFIEEGSQYKLQIKNIFGIWITQTESIGNVGGSFKQPYTNKDKKVLLKYVIYVKYWTNRNDSVIEYPTIKKYKVEDL